MSDNQTQSDPKKDENLDELQSKIRQAEAQDIAKEEALAKKTEDADEKEAQMEELKNALARAMADLQNFKRRSEEDRARFVKFANAELLLQLLPIIDHFDRSTEHLPNKIKDNDWAKGIIRIHDELLKTLEKIGVKKMKTIGEKLDPNFHEALISCSGKKDVIVEELEAGYLYQDEVLKPAKVKVGDGTK